MGWTQQEGASNPQGTHWDLANTQDTDTNINNDVSNPNRVFSWKEKYFDRFRVTWKKICALPILGPVSCSFFLWAKGLCSLHHYAILRRRVLHEFSTTGNVFTTVFLARQ
eukprot:g64647.t1